MEQENLKVALDYTNDEKQEGETLLRFVTALWWYWRLTNHLPDTGWEWLEKALNRDDIAKDSAVYAKALYARAAAAARVMNRPRNWKMKVASDDLIKSNNLYGRLGDTEGVVTTLVLGMEALGAYEKTDTLLEETFQFFANAGDERNEWLMAWIRMHQGCIAVDQEDFDRAHALFSESIELYKRVGDQHGIWEVGINQEQMAQIEDVVTNGWGEWEPFYPAMELALSGVFSEKMKDKQIGWWAYVYPNPHFVNYEVRREKRRRQKMTKEELEGLEAESRRLKEKFKGIS